MRVDIVTRAHRGIEWLERCYESITGLNLDWTWHILATPDIHHLAEGKMWPRVQVYTAPRHESVHDALAVVNYYLDVVPDHGQWFFNLDDDNLMHPNFNKVVSFGQKAMVLFSQQVTPTWRRLIDPNQLGPGQIDMAQFAANRGAIGHLRFWPVYRGDSYFIQEMVFRHREQVAYCVEVMSYYNAQRSPFTDRA